MGYDWMRYLVTRYEPGDGPQNQMVSFMRSMFGEHVLNYPMLKSTAISDAGITKQTSTKSAATSSPAPLTIGRSRRSTTSTGKSSS